MINEEFLNIEANERKKASLLIGCFFPESQLENDLDPCERFNTEPFGGKKSQPHLEEDAPPEDFGGNLDIYIKWF